MSEEGKKSTKIGAAWWREKNGNNYLSGKIRIDGKEHYIALFQNGFKQAEKQPDFNILLSDRDE